MKDNKDYVVMAGSFLHEMLSAIVPHLTKKPFEGEINYLPCRVEILSNDFATVWVKWGDKFDCEYTDLPPVAMAVIAKTIIEGQ